MLVQLGGGTKRAQADGPVELLLECHERIRRFIALARTAAEKIDAPAAEILDACQRVERYFREALPLHVQDEEQSVLPRLRGASAEIDRVLTEMESQHHDHDPKLQTLFVASRGVREQPGDPQRHRALLDAADALAAEFDVHLAAEERVLFPAVRALPAEQQAQLVAEVRGRRTPKP